VLAPSGLVSYETTRSREHLAGVAVNEGEAESGADAGDCYTGAVADDLADLALIRPTVVEVDLACLAENFRAIRAAVAPAAVMPIVKANAYGHGLVPVARHLVALGAGSLGVACEDLAGWAGTIPYEILTNINTRVPRVYV